MALRILEVRQLNTKLQVGTVAFQLHKQSHLHYRRVNNLKPQLHHTLVSEAKLEVQPKF